MSIRTLRVTEKPRPDIIVFIYPRIRTIVYEGCRPYIAYMDIERDEHRVTRVHVDIRERSFGGGCRISPPVIVVRTIAQMFPKSWKVEVSVPMWLGANDLAAGILEKREGRHQFAVSDLSIFDADNEDVIRTLNQLRRCDKLTHMGISLSAGTVSGTTTFDMLMAIRKRTSKLVLSCDDPSQQGASAVTSLLKHIPYLRQFNCVILLGWSPAWLPAHQSKSQSQHDRGYLAVPIPKWDGHSAMPSAPDCVELVFGLADIKHLDYLKDSDALVHVSRYIRLAASVMLLIGGSAASYSLFLSDNGMDAKTDKMRGLARKLLERMLRDEVARLIEEGSTGRTAGWRRLEKEERTEVPLTAA